jgi:hypothetical protein
MARTCPNVTIHLSPQPAACNSTHLRPITTSVPRPDLRLRAAVVHASLLAAVRLVTAAAGRVGDAAIVVAAADDNRCPVHACSSPGVCLLVVARAVLYVDGDAEGLPPLRPTELHLLPVLLKSSGTFGWGEVRCACSKEDGSAHVGALTGAEVGRKPA